MVELPRSKARFSTNTASSLMIGGLFGDAPAFRVCMFTQIIPINSSVYQVRHYWNILYYSFIIALSRMNLCLSTSPQEKPHNSHCLGNQQNQKEGWKEVAAWKAKWIRHPTEVHLSESGSHIGAIPVWPPSFPWYGKVCPLAVGAVTNSLCWY